MCFHTLIKLNEYNFLHTQNLLNRQDSSLWEAYKYK